MSINKYTKTGGISPLYLEMECRKEDDRHTLEMVSNIMSVIGNSLPSINLFGGKNDNYIDDLIEQNNLLREEINILHDEINSLYNSNLKVMANKIK